jgi:hypothetical protein
MIPHPLNELVNSASTEAGVCLRQLVDGLVGNSLVIATDKCSAITNEVSQGVLLRSENLRAIQLLEELLHTVIINSKKGDIHISAKRQEDKVLVTIQERNNNNGYALSFSVGALVPDVNTLGAALDMNGEKSRVATIILSFSDRKAA